MSRKKLSREVVRLVNREHFIEIAKSAPEWNYEKQISLDWALSFPPGDCRVLGSFEFSERHSEPCEIYTRLVVLSMSGTVVVDVTNEFFETLPVASVIYEGDDLMFAIFPDSDGNPHELCHMGLTSQTRRAMRKYAKKAKDERLSQLVERTLANAA